MSREIIFYFLFAYKKNLFFAFFRETHILIPKLLYSTHISMALDQQNQIDNSEIQQLHDQLNAKGDQQTTDLINHLETKYDETKPEGKAELVAGVQLFQTAKNKLNPKEAQLAKLLIENYDFPPTALAQVTNDKDSFLIRYVKSISQIKKTDNFLKFYAEP